MMRVAQRNGKQLTLVLWTILWTLKGAVLKKNKGNLGTSPWTVPLVDSVGLLKKGHFTVCVVTNVEGTGGKDIL